MHKLTLICTDHEIMAPHFQKRQARIGGTLYTITKETVQRLRENEQSWIDEVSAIERHLIAYDIPNRLLFNEKAVNAQDVVSSLKNHLFNAVCTYNSHTKAVASFKKDISIGKFLTNEISIWLENDQDDETLKDKFEDPFLHTHRTLEMFRSVILGQLPKLTQLKSQRKDALSKEERKAKAAITKVELYLTQLNQFISS